jgi:hypothetical protein
MPITKKTKFLAIHYPIQDFSVERDDEIIGLVEAASGEHTDTGHGFGGRNLGFRVPVGHYEAVRKKLVAAGYEVSTAPGALFPSMTSRTWRRSSDPEPESC